MSPKPNSDHAWAAIDVVNRFSLCADARDWATAIDCLSNTVEFAPEPGGPGVTLPALALVERIKANVLAFDATQHLAANHVVVPTPQGVECTVSFRFEHMRNGRCWTLGGRQQYCLSHAADGWRIAAVAMLSTWQHGDRSLLRAPAVADDEPRD